MKILFYIEPRVDLGNPYLRERWLTYFTDNLLSTLRKSHRTEGWEYCIALNEPLAQKYETVEGAEIKVFTQKELFPLSIGDAIDLSMDWYKGSYTEEQISYYTFLMKNKFADFIPDIIITFTPVPYLKKAFPNTLILHHEASFFNEPPYPWEPYLDPLGMHFSHASFFNRFQDDIKKIKLTKEQSDLVTNFKSKCQSLILAKSPYRNILKPFREKFDHLVLMPLVGEGHHGFNAACKLNINHEYQYIVHVLDHIPENIGVVMTYPPQILTPYREETISFLRKRYPNFIYHEDFETYNSISQFLIAEVDMVVGLSSSICFQTLIWDKKFLDLGDLSFIADSSKLENIEDLFNKEYTNKDNILYWLLTRHGIPKEYIYNHEWLTCFLESSLNKFRRDGITYDFLNPIDKDYLLFENLSENLNDNIPQYPPNISYNRLKKSYEIIGSQYEKMKSMIDRLCNSSKDMTIEQMIVKGEQLAINGNLKDGFEIFSKSLEKVNKTKCEIVNNLAVIHIHLGEFDIAENLLSNLVKDGYASNEASTNLQIVQQLKNQIKIPD